MENLLQGGYNPEDPAAYAAYKKIYLDSCRQGIMSVSTGVVHPSLSLERKFLSPARIRKHFERQHLRDRYGLNFRYCLHNLARHYRDVIFPMTCTRLRPLHMLTNAAFRFDDLPLDVRFRIWKLVIPNSELIHCLSRLDPDNPPMDFIPEKVSYPHRFHIGQEKCIIAKADKPSRFLNYFRVSKEWYYVLAHFFYGQLPESTLPVT